MIVKINPEADFFPTHLLSRKATDEDRLGSITSAQVPTSDALYLGQINMSTNLPALGAKMVVQTRSASDTVKEVERRRTTTYSKPTKSFHLNETSSLGCSTKTNRTSDLQILGYTYQGRQLNSLRGLPRHPTGPPT